MTCHRVRFLLSFKYLANGLIHGLREQPSKLSKFVLGLALRIPAFGKPDTLDDVNDYRKRQIYDIAFCSRIYCVS